MMTHYHALVWIDHHEAKIFGVSPEESDKTVVADRAPPHHIHGRTNHSSPGAMAVDSGFFREVATALEPAHAVLIAGPGRAKTELSAFLTEHYPAIAKRVWGVEPMDHPTDNELVAAARKFFRAEDRMHQ